MIERTAAGFILAAAIALIAYRGRSLSPGGAAAAVVVGTLSAAAGWDWAALLVVFFASSVALSRLGAEIKARRTAQVVAKGGARDALQVLANGGVFACSAVAMAAAPWVGWQAIGAGALAAAAADTWATEVGTLASEHPRSIATLRPVPPGVSGGVTAPGLLASVAGALLLALAASLLRWPPAIGWGVALGGTAGALADSLLGALWQSRRQCPRCGGATERAVHTCGTTTTPAGGLAWLDNDGVNVLSSAVGGAVALLVLLSW